MEKSPSFPIPERHLKCQMVMDTWLNLPHLNGPASSLKILVVLCCVVQNSYSNEPHSTNHLHCDMRKDINVAHYLGQIFIQDGWISPLRMCPRRTMEGIDMHSVIKAFCEHEDMGPLAYVIGTAAALRLHWPALAAPSSIKTLACRIAQYFQGEIGAPEQFLPKLRFLTVNHDMAQALMAHGL